MLNLPVAQHTNPSSATVASSFLGIPIERKAIKLTRVQLTEALSQQKGEHGAGSDF
jgi:hypothetical protein